MLKINKSVKLGGFKFDILFPYNFRESTELVGQHSFEDLKIKVSNTDHFDIMSDQKIIAVLLHELLHAVEHVYWNDGCMTESEVDMVARGMFQIINNNKFELNKIPKKINILGFKYDIIYPYIFVDEDNCITASFNEKCQIYIGNSSRIEVSFSYLLAQYVSAIFTINMSPPPVPDGLRIGRGLYDLFVNNPWLIPLIKSV